MISLTKLIIVLFLSAANINAANIFPEWKSNDVFLVIDIQKDFPAANNIYLLKFISDEIKAAKVRRDLIVFLTCTLTGLPQSVCTLPCIERIACNYASKLPIVKMEDSGFCALQEAFDAYGINGVAHIRVCGVNTNACVAKTVLDLHEYMDVQEIHVLRKGCASINADAHEETLTQFQTMNSSKLRVY